MATIAELVAQLGEGWTPVSDQPVEDTKVVKNPAYDPVTNKNVPPTIQQGTGQYYITVQDPNQHQRALFLKPQPIKGGLEVPISGTDQKPENVYTGDLRQVQWDQAGPVADVPKTDTKEEVNARIAASNAQVAQANAAAQKSAEDLKTIQENNRQIEANKAAGRGGLTDEQIATLDKQAKDQNLTQQQVDIAKQTAENNNTNTKRSNEIAALNASVAAQNAATTATATDARIKYEEGQLGLDQAKFEHTKAQDEIAQRNAETKIKLDQLTQQQANEIQQGTLAQRGVEAAETARHNVAEEQRQAQQAQQAGITAAGQAAGNILTNVTNAAQVGAGMLNQRVSSSTGALNQYISAIGNNKSIMSPAPAGIGASLGKYMNEWVTQAGGGPAVYDAAAAMVNAAHPNITQSPELMQQAYTAMRGMLDLYKQQNGQPHPLEQQAQPQGYTSPVTAGGAATATPAYGPGTGQLGPAYGAGTAPQPAPVATAPQPVATATAPQTYGQFAGAMPNNGLITTNIAAPAQPLPIVTSPMAAGYSGYTAPRTLVGVS